MTEDVPATRREKAVSFCKEHWRKAGVALVVVGVGGVALAMRDTSPGTTTTATVVQAVGTVTKGPANNADQYKDPATQQFAVDPDKN